MEEIRNRLEEFKNFDRSNYEKVFEELVFCLLTPQSKAVAADKAVNELLGKGFLFGGSFKEVSLVLKESGVRFHNTKARRIINARNKELVFDRDWLVENINGFGLKEASHFLRNVGVFGHAILDRHILKNLLEEGVIREVPKHLGRKAYLRVEREFKKHAQSKGLSVEELDLFYWSSETGKVFK